MNTDKLASLKIEPTAKRRSRVSLYVIFLGVLGITGAAVFFMKPWAKEGDRVLLGAKGKPGADAPPGGASSVSTAGGGPGNVNPGGTNPPPATPADSVLTVSGYIINRERIELSPRFMGMVKWIGVKKGDTVSSNQVVVLLDDTEYRARLAELEARLVNARVSVERAELAYQRTQKLASQHIESAQLEDDARLNLESARATVKEVAGQLALTQTYVDWCTIRSPINGVVLEKLVDPNELVTPQSFGGTRGPSTALIAVADPSDLQVEIDLNESDLGKIARNQKCRVSPEAYPDRHYEGFVAEIAPEASRQKGTLQIKVQIRNPDHFLTPELSAKVDFLGAPPAEGR